MKGIQPLRSAISLLRFTISELRVIHLATALITLNTGFEKLKAETLLDKVYGGVLAFLGFLALFILIYRALVFKKTQEKKLLVIYYEILSKFIAEITKGISGIQGDFRISLFIIHPDHKKKAKAKIILVGRVSKFHSQAYTNITFEVGKGCVGKVFEYGSPVYQEMPNFAERSEEYYEISERMFNLTKKEVDKLSVKARCYLGIPVREGNSRVSPPIAVVVVDTKETTSISQDTQTKLEKVFSTHSLAIKIILQRFKDELSKL